MQLSAEVHERLPDQCILKSMAKEELEELLAYAVARTLAKGEMLFERGDPGDSMMIVLSGSLKACVCSSSGKEVVFDYIGTGGIVGEIAVLDGEPRTARVVAVEPTELIVLQRRYLLPYLARHSRAALKIIEMLCQRLRRTDALVEDGAALAMEPKLARGLLRLAADHGVRDPITSCLRVAILQSDLGSYVGLSRENVNRQLREWAADGYIDVSRGQITILDPEALAEIAESIE